MESIFTKIIQAVKVNDSSLDTAKRRVVKFLRFGKDDVQTAPEASSFGIDSNPLKNQIAIYAQTEKNGKAVIIGYLNKDQKAAKGEIRIFSKSSTGEEKSSIWLKADGDIVFKGKDLRISAFNGTTEKAYVLIDDSGVVKVGGDSIEILGNAKHLTEFEALKTGFDTFVTNFNSFITTFNAHVHPTAAVGPPSPTPTPGIASSAAIDSAKLNNVKTA